MVDFEFKQPECSPVLRDILMTHQFKASGYRQQVVEEHLRIVLMPKPRLCPRWLWVRIVRRVVSLTFLPTVFRDEEGGA